MRKVIVSGATSMVGIALIEECIKHDIKVLALVRKGTCNLSRLPDSEFIKIEQCDLAEMSSWDISENDYDVFFHFGWTNTDRCGRKQIDKQLENIQFSLDAVKLAKSAGCKKFVGAGSQAEYGIHLEEKTRPDSKCDPQDAYGICKFTAGKLCELEAKKKNMDYIWVRIFSLYGKYEQSETLIQTILPLMLMNKKCCLTKGIQNWDYLYSSDAGEAFYLIGENMKGIHYYCLGSGQARSIRSYMEEMKLVLHSESELGFGEIPYEQNNFKGMCADISKLRRDLKWRPRTSFADGILLEANRVRNIR